MTAYEELTGLVGLDEGEVLVCDKDTFDRFRALVYAKRAYRDSDSVEKNHAALRVMDIELYTEVLDELEWRFCTYKKLYLADTEMFTTEIGLDALKMLHGGWDDPQELCDAVYKRGMTPCEFVLAGEFEKGCREGRVMTPEQMVCLNRDIYNRFYTLCCRDII